MRAPSQRVCWRARCVTKEAHALLETTLASRIREHVRPTGRGDAPCIAVAKCTTAKDHNFGSGGAMTHGRASERVGVNFKFTARILAGRGRARAARVTLTLSPSSRRRRQEKR